MHLHLLEPKGATLVCGRDDEREQAEPTREGEQQRRQQRAMPLASTRLLRRKYWHLERRVFRMHLHDGGRDSAPLAKEHDSLGLLVRPCELQH